MAESGPQKASEPDPDASRHSETAAGQRVSYVAKNGFDAKGNACILATDVAFEERAPSPRASPRSVAQTASGGKARVRGTCLWFSNAYGFVAVDEEFWARMGFEPSSQKPRFEVFIHRAAVEHLPDACVRKELKTLGE